MPKTDPRESPHSYDAELIACDTIADILEKLKHHPNLPSKGILYFNIFEADILLDNVDEKDQDALDRWLDTKKAVSSLIICIDDHEFAFVTNHPNFRASCVNLCEYLAIGFYRFIGSLRAAVAMGRRISMTRSN